MTLSKSEDESCVNRRGEQTKWKNVKGNDEAAHRVCHWLVIHSMVLELQTPVIIFLNFKSCCSLLPLCFSQLISAEDRALGTMSICWSCYTKLTTRSIVRPSTKSLQRPLCLPIIPLCQPTGPRRHGHSDAFGVSINEQIRSSPLPPPGFGSIRERLLQWQEEYGSKIEDPASAEYEARKLQAYTWGADDDSNNERANADSLNYWQQELGEVGAQLSRAAVRPGSLVEIT